MQNNKYLKKIKGQKLAKEKVQGGNTFSCQ